MAWKAAASSFSTLGNIALGFSAGAYALSQSVFVGTEV